MFVHCMLLSFLIACHGQEGPDQGADPTAPVPVKNSKGMEGRIKIAGNIFQVSCDCSEHALQNAASQISSTHKAASCRQPSKLHIFADRVSSVASAKTGTEAVMTSSTLQTRLPDPKSCDIADATKRTLDYTHKKEIKPILGSMGGEIGEFVLALSVYTQILGITDTAKMDVKPYLEQWLNFTKSQGRMFSYQYDVDSIKVLQESVSGLDDRNVLIMKENRPATAQVAPEPELATLILGEGDVDGMKDPAALGTNPRVVFIFIIFYFLFFCEDEGCGDLMFLVVVFIDGRQSLFETTFGSIPKKKDIGGQRWGQQLWCGW